MRKYFQTLIALALTSSIYGCDQSKSLVVQPIDAEFHQHYLTGKDLDPNLYSRKEVMQYYQVANYTGLGDHRLLSELDSVARASNTNHHQKLTVLFYKKRLFVDYRDHLYESARENESGRLSGYDEDLLVSIIYERTKNNMLVRRLLYNNNKLKLKKLIP